MNNYFHRKLSEFPTTPTGMGYLSTMEQPAQVFPQKNIQSRNKGDA